VRADSLRQELRVAHLKRIDQAGNEVAGGAGVHHRRHHQHRAGERQRVAAANSAPERAAAVRHPLGHGKLSLRNANPAQTLQLKDWLEQNLIEDILFVVSYARSGAGLAKASRAG